MNRNQSLYDELEHHIIQIASTHNPSSFIILMDKQASPTKPFTLSKDRQQQILRKLDSSVHSQQDFKKIIASLEQQNVRLRQQLKLVGDKVLKLLNKNQLKPQANTRAIEGQILKAKAQLQTKYRQFDKFKLDVQNSRNRVQDIMLTDKYAQFNAELKQLDRQLISLRNEKKLLEGINKQLDASLSQYRKETMPDKDKLEELVSENKELRRRTMMERKKDDKIDQEAIRVQQTMVTLALKERRLKKPEILPKSMRTLKTITYDKSEILNQSLNQEIDALKQKKNKIIDQDQKKRNKLAAKKTDLESHKQSLMDKAKKLQEQKIKLLQQYNKYEAFLAQSNKKEIVKEPPKEIASQTDQTEHLFRLRRDYAGILGKIRFDDRISVLLENFSAKIFKILVFQNDKGIATVKFTYFNSLDQKQFFQGVTPLSQTYLQKCKKRTFQVQPPNFFKLFKVKTNTQQRRITKFEIIANGTQKCQFGQKKAFQVFDKDDAVYSFDINIQEYPASMFGSVQQIGQEWYLQSLGAEIRDSKQAIEQIKAKSI